MRKLLIILFLSVLHDPTFGNNDEEAKQLAQLAQDYADKEDEVEIKKEKSYQRSCNDDLSSCFSLETR